MAPPICSGERKLGWNPMMSAVELERCAPHPWSSYYPVASRCRIAS
jgi:hypothetical protein